MIFPPHSYGPYCGNFWAKTVSQITKLAKGGELAIFVDIARMQPKQVFPIASPRIHPWDASTVKVSSKRRERLQPVSRFFRIATPALSRTKAPPPTIALRNDPVTSRP
jgi:hypothetical protein